MKLQTRTFTIRDLYTGDISDIWTATHIDDVGEISNETARTLSGCNEAVMYSLEHRDDVSQYAEVMKNDKDLMAGSIFSTMINTFNGFQWSSSPITHRILLPNKQMKTISNTELKSWQTGTVIQRKEITLAQISLNKW